MSLVTFTRWLKPRRYLGGNLGVSPLGVNSGVRMGVMPVWMEVVTPRVVTPKLSRREFLVGVRFNSHSKNVYLINQ